MNKGADFIKRVFIITLALVLLISNYSYAAEGKIASRNKLLLNEATKFGKKLWSLGLQASKNRAESIPVLLYHHILPQKEMDEYKWNNNSSVISLEKFQEQMKYLHENNYYTASLAELELFLDKKMDLPKNTVVITFDDGYLSNVTYAYPVMKQYGFRGSVFLVGKSSLVESEEFKPEELQHVPIGDLDKYEDVFEFGCHTFDLHYKDIEKKLPLLEVLPKDEIIEDLTKNLELLNTKYIAYPFGGYNLKTIECLQELNYTLGFTVKHGYASREDNKYELPRIIITPGVEILKFIDFIQGNK